MTELLKAGRPAFDSAELKEIEREVRSPVDGQGSASQVMLAVAFHLAEADLESARAPAAENWMFERFYRLLATQAKFQLAMRWKTNVAFVCGAFRAITEHDELPALYCHWNVPVGLKPLY